MAANDKSETCKHEINPSLGMKITLKGIAAKFNNVQHISTSTLSDWLESQPENVILLDTRPDIEYNISHLKGARRIDYESDEIENILQSLPQNNQTDSKENVKVVCYCSIGYRSSLMAKKLQQHFKQQSGTKPEIYNLEGSLFKWANEKREMVDQNNQPTVYAHPYNSLWGKLLDKDLRREGT
ncbi:hypothetical protein LOTGIDRAFT_166268 [Lottia gigantea]|uniref:Rhodanese domain-containing protein n=1 Tax=Lottia gigantea TaxID=225164 RepID=V4A302_LOTGI|nr:hypothetical protein LOTGIDRAFT_166268 [Lottia gigantea]ESO87686.1 hypothetical protein LOTGIDRAFT_166268 [Lottia gigantea]